MKVEHALAAMPIIAIYSDQFSFSMTARRIGNSSRKGLTHVVQHHSSQIGLRTDRAKRSYPGLRGGER